MSVTFPIYNGLKHYCQCLSQLH